MSCDNLACLYIWRLYSGVEITIYLDALSYPASIVIELVVLVSESRVVLVVESWEEAA